MLASVVSLAVLAQCFQLVAALSFHGLEMCEDIKVQSCQSVLPYHHTKLPNSFGHHRQSLIARSVSSYLHSKAKRCSEDLAFFVCAYHLPMCFPGFPEIKVCRSLCEQVKQQCNSTIHAHKQLWPEFVLCEDLPSKASDVCIEPSSVFGYDKQAMAVPTNPACHRCAGKQNLTEEMFMSRKFDYVIKVRVKALNGITNGTAISVKVLRVFKHGHVRVQKGHVTLWEGNCGCHGFQISNEYFIGGHEKPALNRLMVTQISAVEVWKTDWHARAKSWVLKMKEAQQKRRQ